MAAHISRMEFKQQYNRYHQGLFITFSEKRFPKDQHVINLGLDLSQALSEYPVAERAAKVGPALAALVQPFSEVSLSHIELLFTDYLHLDVVRALLALCRNRKICVFWPGREDASKLVYASPEIPEYYECDPSVLQDTYIISE